MPELLNDMDGQGNTQILRDWFENNSSYAACQPDFAHGWYLPSAGQLRKLYAALPMVESIIINANGTLMTENSYWSSTERGSGTAWTPAFEMSSNNKGYGCRVRAISGSIETGPQEITQTVVLSAGTNWVSFYVDITLADLQTALTDVLGTGNNVSIMIQSKTQNCKLTRGRWTGHLQTLDLGYMYKITVNSDCDITLEGMLVDPADHPVTIPGQGQAVWIAFPFNVDMTLTSAFAGFAVNGDVLKAKNGNANYTRGRWAGQLQTLEPGQGYIYKSSTSAGDRILIFPSSKK